MKIGTKSVLFGAHCFFIHPWFVAWAWWKLYGFPWDPRLWAAFFLHDIGYLGKPNMDGPEGESHPALGARIMHWLFDRKEWTGRCFAVSGRNRIYTRRTYWHDLCLYHSRYYAKAQGHAPSRLCVADKLAYPLTPWWIYLPCVLLTGEIREYFDHARQHGGGRVVYSSPRAWHRSLSAYMRDWVEKHKDGQPDNHTRVRHPTRSS